MCCPAVSGNPNTRIARSYDIHSTHGTNLACSMDLSNMCIAFLRTPFTQNQDNNVSILVTWGSRVVDPHLRGTEQHWSSWCRRSAGVVSERALDEYVSSSAKRTKCTMVGPS